MAVALEVKNPVLLGFPDETIEDDIVIDFSVSKIGGLPVSIKVQIYDRIVLIYIYSFYTHTRKFLSRYMLMKY